MLQDGLVQCAPNGRPVVRSSYGSTIEARRSVTVGRDGRDAATRRDAHTGGVAKARRAGQRSAQARAALPIDRGGPAQGLEGLVPSGSDSAYEPGVRSSGGVAE